MPYVDQVPPPKDALQRLIDGLQTLVKEHLALARAEAREDVKALGRDALVGAAGVPLLAAGYVLLMVAIALLLALWLPRWIAFGIVALCNLGAGGAVTYAGINRLKGDRRSLPKTGEELQRDKQWLASMRGADGERPWQQTQ